MAVDGSPPDTNLFGEVVSPPKPRARRTAKRVTEPEPTPPHPETWSAYVRRLLKEGAHSGAVQLIGLAIVALVTAGLTEIRYGWLKPTMAEIGEWSITVKRGE